jgi:sec-independent protein translocase protein TatA
MGTLRPWHIIILVGVLILLFGAKKLPDAARSLGRSMRIFKAETRGLMEDDVRGKAEAQTHPAEPRLRDDEPSPLPGSGPLPRSVPQPQPEQTHDDRR